MDIEQMNGDVFFTVAISNEDGETHTERVSAKLLAEFVKQGVKFTVDTNNAAIREAVNKLGYGEINVIEYPWGDNFEVYYHGLFVWDGEIEVDTDGEFKKHYKRKGFADRLADALTGMGA